MIVLLALTGSFVIGRHLAKQARERLQSGQMAGEHDHQAMVGVSEDRQAELEREPLSEKLRSRAAWSDAASYTVADLTMLRRELVVGYVIAGFLAVLVPIHTWNAVFLHGHGVWTTLENVIVGPFIAIISFVCSIGNVITLPLLLIYRKYYGTRLTVRLLLWFWAVMAVAGLIVEELFSATGLIPHDRSQAIAQTHFQWNFTTFLNIAFIAIGGYLYWLYRNRTRFGGGTSYAIDPLCGMQVQTANAPAHRTHDGRDYYFCSDRCAERFSDDPDRHAKPQTPNVA